MSTDRLFDAPALRPREAAAVPPFGDAPPRIEVAVHDASRLAWHVALPLPPPGEGRAAYSLELEIEVPSNLVGTMDPWAALQSYARLDAGDDPREVRPRSTEAFRRAVVAVSSRIARARDGFARHCTSARTSALAEEDHVRPLRLWLDAAAAELAEARAKLLPSAPAADEAALADEFLSGQLWTAFTDCGRALLDARRAIEERGRGAALGKPALDRVEGALAAALVAEMSYRQAARLPFVDPPNARQLEQLLSRMRWLKKHFERVLFLDVESYQVARRLAGWLSSVTAMLAYLWFLFWQLTLERRAAAIGSGVVALALATAAAYASRERLKEIGRNWLAGRVQRMFAQRVTRYKLPARGRPRGDATAIAARESFSQSSAQRPDPVHPDCDTTHEVTVLRFVHRGRAGALAEQPAREVRLVYRLDLSALFPRLHDAVRGLASIDAATGAIAIVDVPRNYELPVRAAVRWSGGAERAEGTLVLNKNGLVRFDAAA